MHTNQALYDELHSTMMRIDAQIKTIVEERIKTIVEESASPIYGVVPDVNSLRNASGDYLMVPLLAARAQCLSAMVTAKSMAAPPVITPPGGSRRGKW